MGWVDPCDTTCGREDQLAEVAQAEYSDVARQIGGHHAEHSLWGPGGRQLALFAPSVDARRVRRTSDVVLAVASALAVWLLGLVALPPSGFEAAVIGLVDAVPGFLAILWRLSCGLLVVWVAVLVIMTALRRRAAIGVDVLVALVAAAAIGTVVAQRLNGAWPSLDAALTGGSNGLVPAVGLGAAVAVSATIAPQLSRPFRRTGWAVVLGATASMVLLGSTTPSGALLGCSIGVLAAAVVHLALGTQAGHPGTADLTAALGELGVEVVTLAVDRRPDAGVYTLDGTTSDEQPFVVRVYGRDAWDTQVLATLWRSLLYRESSAPALTRLQQVEHEAFVTLMAASRGVRVPEVVAAGRTSSGDALFVLGDVGVALPLREPEPAADPATIDGGGVGDESWITAPAPARPTHEDRPDDGPRLPEVQPDPTLDGRLADMWALVDSLHDAGLGFGDVGAASFALGADGRVRVADLRAAVVAPSEDQRRTDLAQLLVVSTLVSTTDRAVVAASAAIGPDGLASILPYLQPAAVSRNLRAGLKERTTDVDSIRAAAAAAAGVEPPRIARLRRVSSATLFRVGLLSLIAFALITTLSGISLDELRSELSGAAWGWVVAAVVVGQLPFLTQAVAAKGACPRPLAYGPLAVLQFAIGFINLAIPSSAARIALDVRYFQRQGVPPAAAVSIAAIDGFSGFLVQIALLIATLVFGIGAVDLTVPRLGGSGDGSDDNNLALIVGAGLVLVVVAVVVAVAVPRIRHRIAARVSPLLGQVRDTVRSLRSPAKLAQLFGGCLANQVLFALTLGACLHAFGAELNLATLLVVYVAAALFGGMMPVPGGIGVMEAALIAGLVAGGIPSTTATAAAVTFRVVTFYLPPVWGWGAFSWLQRHAYL